MKTYLIGIMLLLLALPAVAQKPLRFNEQLTFRYRDKGTVSEFSVYLNRKTSSWLFTNADSFGGTADGIDFVLGQANGTYLVCGTDDVGHRSCQTFDSPLVRKKTATVSGRKINNAARVFGKNKYGWPTLSAFAWELAAGRMTERVFLSAVPFNCAPLYGYNFLLGIEHYLPAFGKIDYPTYLPGNQLVVSDSGVELVSLSPTEYEIDLKTYQK